MPLSDLQREILRLLAAHRNLESFVAGAVPLQQDGPRYSSDIDIFHDREEAVAGRLPQRWRVLAARIRRPRRQDRALLVERQIRVLDHLTRIRKGASRAQQRQQVARTARAPREWRPVTGS